MSSGMQFDGIKKPESPKANPYGGQIFRSGQVLCITRTQKSKLDQDFRKKRTLRWSSLVVEFDFKLDQLVVVEFWHQNSTTTTGRVLSGQVLSHVHFLHKRY